jgi:hypothetical protein
MNTEISPSMTASSNSKPTARKYVRAVVLTLIALALSTSYLVDGWLDSKTATPAVGKPAVDLRQTIDAIKADLEKIDGETVAEELRLWEAFGTDMENTRKQSRSTCRAGVNKVVSQLVQADQIGWLIADFAQDKVLGGSRATKRVQQSSTDLVTAMQSATTSTADLVSALEQRIDALHNEHAARMGGVIHSYEGRLPAGDLKAMAGTFERIPLRVGVNIGGVAFGAALEVWFVKSTQESLRKVMAFLARRLGPQIARAATGVGAVVVDGPLPVGDIIAVGLAAWTAYEVFQLPDSIRETVRGEYQAAADTHLSVLDAEVKSALEKLMQQAREQRQQLHSELLAQITK